MKFLIFLLFPLSLFAQPTFFGGITNPTDNAALSISPADVTPPASMVTGDLVVMIGVTRTTSATVAISVTGGQTWTSETVGGTTDQTVRLFWCRYNGTWAANPSISFSATLSTSVAMMVFRPTSGTKLWAVDQVLINTAYAAPLTPFTVSVTGVTNAKINNVTTAFILSTDDNAYNALTGAGWTAGMSGNIYRRNIGGSDQSILSVYRLSATTGASGNVTANQSSNGGDAGTTVIISFYELAAAANMPLNLIIP